LRIFGQPIELRHRLLVIELAADCHGWPYLS
jgi:hypothetical protein